MASSIIVFGASSVAKNVIDICLSLSVRIDRFVDETQEATEIRTLYGIPVSSSMDEALEKSSTNQIVVAVGASYSRDAVYKRMLSEYPEINFRTLIHPDATISRSCEIGAGSIIMAGSRLAFGAQLGNVVYLNANTVVAHDVNLGTAVTMNPGSTTGGSSSIGERSVLGMNASIREKVSIGSDVVVAAHSFVNKDFADSLILAGTPARVLRTRTMEQRYLR